MSPDAEYPHLPLLCARRECRRHASLRQVSGCFAVGRADSPLRVGWLEPQPVAVQREQVGMPPHRKPGL
jgi:hypothetical protein